MSDTLSPAAPQILRDYYRILTAGPGAYDAGKELRPLLAEHLDFTGALAGHRPDSTAGFLHGVAGFIGVVRRIEFVAEVHSPVGSAVVYDAELPGGIVRFAESFTYEDGRIAQLHLHYDGEDYIAKGGR